MEAGLLLALLWSFLLRVLQVVLCADASCCPHCARKSQGWALWPSQARVLENSDTHLKLCRGAAGAMRQRQNQFSLL